MNKVSITNRTYDTGGYNNTPLPGTIVTTSTGNVSLYYFDRYNKYRIFRKIPNGIPLSENLPEYEIPIEYQNINYPRLLKNLIDNRYKEKRYDYHPLQIILEREGDVYTTLSNVQKVNDSLQSLGLSQYINN